MRRTEATTTLFRGCGLLALLAGLLVDPSPSQAGVIDCVGRADATPCAAGDPCTEGDQCRSGVCVPGRDVCDGASEAGTDGSGVTACPAAQALAADSPLPEEPRLRGGGGCSLSPSGQAPCVIVLGAIAFTSAVARRGLRGQSRIHKS